MSKNNEKRRFFIGYVKFFFVIEFIVFIFCNIFRNGIFTFEVTPLYIFICSLAISLQLTSIIYYYYYYRLSIKIKVFKATREVKAS